MFDALETYDASETYDILDPRGWVDDVEEWRPVAVAPRYDVSTLGQVRRGSKILLPWDSDGYGKVSLYDNGDRFVRFVHKLVLLAFVGPRPAGFDIDHFDHDRRNNKLSNLQYVTAPSNWGCKRLRWTTYRRLNVENND